MVPFKQEGRKYQYLILGTLMTELYPRSADQFRPIPEMPEDLLSTDVSQPVTWREVYYSERHHTAFCHHVDTDFPICYAARGAGVQGKLIDSNS